MNKTFLKFEINLRVLNNKAGNKCINQIILDTYYNI